MKMNKPSFSAVLCWHLPSEVLGLLGAGEELDPICGNLLFTQMGIFFLWECKELKPLLMMMLCDSACITWLVDGLLTQRG